ncbi:uncharacterized protein BDW47DRAFT_11491 [Aspergillus candidus]|uniref:Uncharacterized protein n=1 Tax=Aspergillus candidus TaxID=41067 RepID=A0A2I2FGE0_ASPCN|nr:hypothetical protein BDW47DRAFT_11491 [Aspergillus candidus]PLB39685.1 hypothetical protein BDW47DRAFT_11491 [Aspergillus candidus]
MIPYSSAGSVQSVTSFRTRKRFPDGFMIIRQGGDRFSSTSITSQLSLGRTAQSAGVSGTTNHSRSGIGQSTSSGLVRSGLLALNTTCLLNIIIGQSDPSASAAPLQWKEQFECPPVKGHGQRPFDWLGRIWVASLAPGAALGRMHVKSPPEVISGHPLIYTSCG